MYFNPAFRHGSVAYVEYRTEEHRKRTRDFAQRRVKSHMLRNQSSLAGGGGQSSSTNNDSVNNWMMTLPKSLQQFLKN